MCNPIRPFINFLDKTHSDSLFFKISALVPVVGIVIQCSKDVLLRQEIGQLDWGKCEKSDGKLHENHANHKIYSTAAKKVNKILDLSIVSIKYGIVADLAMIIGGVAVAIFGSGVAGFGLLSLGIGSVATRQIIYFWYDGSLRRDLIAIRPKNADASWSRLL